MVLYLLKSKIRGFFSTSERLKRVYHKLSDFKSRCMRFLPLSWRARILFFENTGEVLRLSDPVTFNEKLWWLKLNNKDPMMTLCSDKYRVREYVEGCGLGEILNSLRGVYRCPSDVDFKVLSGRFFIKMNNGSGVNFFYDSSKPFDIERFESKARLAMFANYFDRSLEWNYKEIEPRIIVEDYIDSERGLVDYRFLCFDGKVRLVFVDIETAAADGSHNPGAKRNVYDENFNFLDVRFHRDNFEKDKVEKPKEFELMRHYAEVLAQPFLFCRVDLYNVNGRIIFGEMTFYPGGGNQKAYPREWEEKVGGWLDINKVTLG